MPKRRIRQAGCRQPSRLNSGWPGRVAAQAKLAGARLREAWAEVVGQIPWQWFLTLSFDLKRVFSVSRATVEHEATWFNNLVCKILRLPVGWVCAVERGRGGLLHAHVLMTADRLHWSPEPAQHAWRARNGRIDLRRVTDQAGIALYTTKTAAEAGTIVLSDTLPRYRRLIGSGLFVPLWLGASEAGVKGKD